MELGAVLPEKRPVTYIEPDFEGMSQKSAQLIADCVRAKPDALLSLAQVAHTFNMRSEGSIFCGRHKGSRLLPAALACAALQCAVILFPPLSGLFKTVPLSGAQWGVVALLALTPIAVVELEKLLARLFGRRKKA